MTLTGNKEDLEIMQMIGKHKHYLETKIIQIKPGLLDVDVSIEIGGIKWI